MLRVSLRPRGASARVAVPVDRLYDLFMRCGLGSIVKRNAVQLRSPVALQAFMPLFTTNFTIESQHLTTLGDIVIDEFLSGEVLQYAMHTGLVLTANACKQLNAVLHNHYALRLFAKELCFDELAVPLGIEELTTTADARPAEGSCANGLEFLSPKHMGLRGSDLMGTSFHITPLRCGQSPLGWVFSHFVGAVHQHFGSDAARELLLHVYGKELDTSLPNVAAALLLRTLERFSPANVAEAILAAQGLQAQFVSRTRALPTDHSDPAVGEGDSRETQGGREMDKGRGAVVCSGFGLGDPERSAVTLEKLVGEMNSVQSVKEGMDVFLSLAAGPGGFDAIDAWKQRVGREEQWLKAAGVVDSSDACSGGGVEDGWLKAEEWESCKRGAAFRNSVDFTAAANYFADSYGQRQPINGQKIARLKFQKTVRDPLFFDKQSDMRNGVPFSTDGEPLSNYIDRLNRPHARLFEVSLVVEGNTAGRAIGWRYTKARESACKAFLGAVLHDLRTMRERSGLDESYGNNAGADSGSSCNSV